MEKSIQLDLPITCQLHLNYILAKFPSSPKILILRMKETASGSQVT